MIMPGCDLVLPDIAATEAFAARLAPCLRQGDVIALEGDLGVGKTTFVRALLRALGVTGDVPSPTFTLMQTYDVEATRFYHFDLYRLKSPDEVDELGWDDALADGVSLVEWPMRAAGRMPARTVFFHFFFDDQGCRRCRFQPRADWDCFL